MHHIEYYLNIIRQAGIKLNFSLPYIYLSLNERIRAKDFLKGLKSLLSASIRAPPTAPTKRWQPEKFAEVSRKIISGSAEVSLYLEDHRKPE